MKSKFEEFNDGVVNVYSVNENDKMILKNDSPIRFGEENVGITRHYTALAAGQKVDKTIHVPLLSLFTTHDIIVIEEEQYNVEKIDNFKDTLPPITKLSLQALDMHRKKEFA